MTTLLIFLLGMCWGAFVVGVVFVIHESWRWSRDRPRCGICGERFRTWLILPTHVELEHPNATDIAADAEGWNPRRYGEGE